MKDKIVIRNVDTDEEVVVWEGDMPLLEGGTTYSLDFDRVVTCNKDTKIVFVSGSEVEQPTEDAQ